HPDASNYVYQLSDLILKKGTNFFATNDIAVFKRSEAYNGLEWKGLPAMSPFLKSQKEKGADFVLAGLIPETGTNIPPGPELTQQILQPANLVCYDWELTGPRVDQWRYIAQFIRFALFKKQMIGESA